MCSMHVGGLASGMDIDQIVSDLMKAERMKVDKLEQEKQVLEWQQEAYRTINLALRGFRDEQAFNMKLQSTFLAKQVTSTNETVVTATGGVNAVEGLHSVEVKQLARGGSVTAGVIGSTDDRSSIKSQLPTAGSDEEFIINDVVFKVNTETDSIYDLLNRINNNSFAGVSLYTAQQAVNPVAEEDITPETTEAEKNGIAQIQTLKLSDDALVEGLTISLADKKIVFYDSTKLDLEAAKGKYDADELIDINGKSATQVMEEIANLSIDDEKVALSYDTDNQEITITSKETGTVNAVSAKITGGKAWTVRASYDETLDRIFLTTNKTGADQQIKVDKTNLSDLLKITDQVTEEFDTADYKGGGVAPSGMQVNYGQNASVVVDGLEITDVYTSNQFTLNNITYSLHNISADGEKTTISITQDSDAIYDTVTDFVDKYNEVIELIENKLEEKRYKDYTWPLSDEQREDLTEDQADQWEKKARSGLLRNDTTLREIRDQLRYSVTQLSKIGITTTSDYFSAKLEVDEDVLRKAIQDDGQSVMNLFTEDTGSSGTEGVGRRVSDILSGGVTNIINKAGSSGNRTDDQSFIGKRIDDLNDDIEGWEDRLTEIEDRYWRQFTAMETAINEMNSQSAYLMQMFGGGA